MSFQILRESVVAGQSTGDAVGLEMRASAFSACLNTVATWIVRDGQRRALRELAEEGRLLRDVGLTRERAFCEAGKPFWRR
jgi:uncharacterized protein YjiS (DUF1127 family)